MAVLLVGLALILRPSQVKATLKSPRAVAILAALVVGWVVLSRVVLPRVVANRWLRRAILVVPAALVVWVLVVPYFRTTTAQELFPGPPTTAAPSTSTSSGLPAPSSSAPAATAPPAPVKLTSGHLVGIDHRASGEVLVLRSPDGGYVVQLEGIDIQPGPDYNVFVVPGANSSRPGGGIDLGDLRATKGTLFYPIPPGFDVSRDFTVLVWCNAFAVPIAHANQVKV